MKKTLQIHIGGRHFHMDEDGYNKLSHYLESLKSHFARDGEEGKEIVEDIEQRIAELLDGKLTPGKEVISFADVQDVIGILGNVEDFVYNDKSTASGEDDYHDRREYRRFYRDGENYYLGGVASGLGEYFDIDPLWIRLAFVALVFLKGLGILIYAILWIVVPKARSTAERLQMKGRPVNLSTIKESVNAEFEKKADTDKYGRSMAAENARNALENVMRAIGLVFVALFKFFIGAIGIFFLIIGSVFLAGLILLLLGVTNVFGHIQVWNGIDLPNLSHMFSSAGNYHVVIICLVILVLIPIVALIYGGIKILFNVRTKHPVLRAFTLTAWILALILFVTLIIANSSNYAVGATGTQTEIIDTRHHPRIYIDARNNIENKSMTEYWVFGYRFNYSKWDESIYSKARLSITSSEDDNMHLSVNRHVKNVGMKESDRYIERVEYQWNQEDSAIYLNEYFSTDGEDFWLFSDLDLNLRVPKDQAIAISPAVCEMIESYRYDRVCNNDSLVNRSVYVDADGDLIPATQKTRSIRQK